MFAKILSNRLQLLDGYDIVKTLGRGKYGVVYSVVPIDDHHTRYAAKVLHRQPDVLTDSGLPLEAQIMTDLVDVPNVVRLVHHFVNNNHSHVLVMNIPREPYVRYSLIQFDQDDHDKRIVLSNLRNILVDINDRHISHMDVHPSNILVNTETLQVTLVDFGRATYTDDNTHDQTALWSLVTTKHQCENTRPFDHPYFYTRMDF